MIDQCSPTTMGLLLSGGLDSAILLGYLLDQGHAVQPFYIRSQLVWQREELAAVDAYLAAVAAPGLRPLVTLDLPLADLYGNHWSVTGQKTPDENTPDEAVYMPGRNSLLVIKAALWCHLHGIDRLALGPLASNPFADATDEFFAQFEAALNRGTAGGLQVLRPFAQLGKREVMQLGAGCPLALTFSCISPRGGLHCGHCNKCAERKAAFRLIAAPDPTRYAVLSETLAEKQPVPPGMAAGKQPVPPDTLADKQPVAPGMAVGKQQLMAPHQQPTVPNQQPMTPNQRPMTPNQRPMARRPRSSR